MRKESSRYTLLDSFFGTNPAFSRHRRRTSRRTPPSRQSNFGHNCGSFDTMSFPSRRVDTLHRACRFCCRNSSIRIRSLWKDENTLFNGPWITTHFYISSTVATMLWVWVPPPINSPRLMPQSAKSLPWLSARYVSSHILWFVGSIPTHIPSS